MAQVTDSIVRELPVPSCFILSGIFSKIKQRSLMYSTISSGRLLLMAVYV